MAIVSSIYNEGHAQIDGRHYVIEQHTDSEGVLHQIEYLASIGSDYVAILAARAAFLEEELANQEFQELSDGA